jgi:uncharacterized protein YndB with AHSA1/START domain
MSTATNIGTTQVYRVWIKATPEAVWDAITQPEWTDRYGYGGLPQYGDLQPGNAYEILAGTGMQKAGVTGPIIDGEILDVDPPNRFVVTWHMSMDPSVDAEPPTRLTYELHAQADGITRLTVIHELEGSPNLAHMVGGGLQDTEGGGGWAWILSDLKSLLETGSPLAG